jgi:hypothetical protein
MRMLLITAAAVACSGSGEDGRPDYRRTGVMEMVFTFSSTGADRTPRPVVVRPSDLRPALANAGDPDAELMATRMEIDGRTVDAILVRVPLHDDDRGLRRQQAQVAISQRYGDRITRISWAGDRLFIRASAALPADQIHKLLESAGLEVSRLEAPSGDLDLYPYVFTVRGPEVAYERAIERSLPGIDAVVASVASVGPGGVH